MPSTSTSVLSALVIVLGLFYQLQISPLIEVGGFFRNVHQLNTEQCEAVEGLQACEKLVIHPSGLVYLACASSPYSRTVWMPTVDHLNATALRELPSKDYVATYEPRSHKVTKLIILGLAEPRGLNLHGMDVVPDEHDPSLLWMYLINHRPPLDPTLDAAKTGADSVVEIFKTRLHSNSIEWVKTIGDSDVIITPNDVIGSPDGKEFWFTNDHGSKVGMSRQLYLYLRIKSTSVGYCHVDTGCKIAADKLYSSNGIVRDTSGNIWVASSAGGLVTINQQKTDKTLMAIEEIKLGRSIDNLALAPDGSVIAAAYPHALHFVGKAVKDINVPTAASAFRISEGDSKGYKVEMIYESDGVALGSGASTASVYQDKLYLHGLLAHRMIICKIPTSIDK